MLHTRTFRSKDSSYLWEFLTVLNTSALYNHIWQLPLVIPAEVMAKDLLDFIDFSNLECLNEKPDHAAANALKQGYREDNGLYLESDTGEEALTSGC